MNQKLFAPSDLYWMIVWSMTKLYYTILPIPVLMRLARFRGWLNSFVSKNRHLVKNNLVSVFGDSKTDKEIRVIMRRHFGYLKECEVMLRLPHLNRFSRPQSCPIEGLSHLDQALARGQGAIVLIAHFGYSKLIHNFLKMRGYEVWVVGARSSRKIKAEKKEKKQIRAYTAFRRFLYERLRVSTDVTDGRDIFADFNVRPLLEVLKKNGILIIDGDAQHAVGYAILPFLGQVYPFPTGFMRVAMGTGAAVLPTFAVVGAEGFGIKVIIEPPLSLETNGRTEQAVTKNLEGFVQIFESYVKRYPYLYRIWSKENWFERKLAQVDKDPAERF
jgi:KDO2-lipid IV(A) lauroyltransferase